MLGKLENEWHSINTRLIEREDMANSLRAKLSKLRHDGHITDNEYQAFLKKLDGHDREIYNKAIDDFAEMVCEKVESFTVKVEGIEVDILSLDYLTEFVFEVAEQLRG